MLAYLISGVFFILALRGLSSPATSQRGNRFGMAGMLIAVVTTLLTHEVASLPEIVGAIAIGGGFGLGLVCDLRVANREARYGANFARLGIHSGMAISYLLPRITSVPRAAELLFTGRVFSGAEAAEMGIANYAVEPGQVLAKSRELAAEIAACAPVAVRMMKRSLYRGLNWDPKAAGEIEAFAQSRTLEMADAKEGVAALLEKRQPQFRGV